MKPSRGTFYADRQAVRYDRGMPDETWPALPYEAWKDTYATLHMWTQIAGKVALALAPPLNHSWGSAFQITPRGLATRTLPHGDRTFTMEFNFVDHELRIRASDGAVRALALRPRTVADFYREVMATLTGMGLPVKVWTMPVEVPSPVRFDEDTAHHSYDPVWVERWWRVTAQTARIFTKSACGFVGKCSPVHFFWGSFDLAVTRFSGRPAPPREGPAFMRDAYSHEVISVGFWPGGDPMPESIFYAYAVPQPAGLSEARVLPDAAYYHRDLGEFVLPYDAVRTSASPDQAIQQFVSSTYDQAATLAGWDRDALARTV
jgi:hypothetical protein